MLPSCSLSCDIRKFVRPLLVKKYFSLISVKQNKINMKKFRSSHWRCPVKKSCSQKFRQIHRKRPYHSLFLIKLRAMAEKRFKKETLAQVFSCEFCEISNNTLFTEHLRTTGFNVFRSFQEPLLYSTALVVVSVLASSLQ